MDTATKIRKSFKNSIIVSFYGKRHVIINSNCISHSITALTQSWKCCKCKSENYIDKWNCSWCGHGRCNSCKNLIG